MARRKKDCTARHCSTRIKADHYFCEECLRRTPKNLIAPFLDAYKAGVPGGTGETFQWTLIPQRWRRRIVLAGGLTPANVNDAVCSIRPQGVDVSGGIEAGKGLKSPEKMCEFMRQVTLADAGRNHR